MVSLRIAKIIKKIVAEEDYNWVSKEDYPNKPTTGGPWYDTPKGWTTFDINNRKYKDDEEIDKHTTIRIKDVESNEEFSQTIANARNITIERGKYRVRIRGKSFGRYSTIEEAKQVAINKRKEVFPISSNLNEKIII